MRTMSMGSAILPLPTSPQARRPSTESIMVTPRSFKMLIFCWTASLSYIFVFMAGQTTLGAFDAIYVVESISSAMPLANLPMTFAVAGATKNKSAFFARDTCFTSNSSTLLKVSVTTALFDKVSKERGAINSQALSVMMTSTFAPSFLRRDTMSQAL